MTLTEHKHNIERQSQETEAALIRHYAMATYRDWQARTRRDAERNAVIDDVQPWELDEEPVTRIDVWPPGPE